MWERNEDDVDRKGVWVNWGRRIFDTITEEKRQSVTLRGIYRKNGGPIDSSLFPRRYIVFV